ncbi:DUF6242 domain-containing protein [Bacteroides sp.]
MRIKFLSVIVSFLSLSLAVTSCLDNDNNIEYSPDAIIKQFAIDTIHGITYNFTINQFGKDGVGEIYNQDSLPLGSDTIIDRILITTLTTASGIITSYNPVTKQDTLFNIADSMDLRNPFTVKVWSLEAYANGGNGPIKQYNIKVNVHKQDPDSMQWVKMESLPSAPGVQKAVILNKDNGEYIYVYTADKTYKTAIGSNGHVSWSEAGSGLSAALTSLVNFKETLYATTGDGKVYQSVDGETWTENAALSGNVDLLLAAFPENDKNLNKEIAGIAGIINDKFVRTDNELTQWIESDNTVPSNFPKLTEAISSTVYLSPTHIQTAMIMGNNVIPKDTASIAWVSQDGLDWIQLPKNSNDSYCPKLENPSVIHYNDAFYAFGSPFNGFYKSQNGIAWYPADSKFWMPAEFKDRKDYSMVVGKDNHIWIMWSNGEVWRGRLNKLGFEPIIR